MNYSILSETLTQFKVPTVVAEFETKVEALTALFELKDKYKRSLKFFWIEENRTTKAVD